MFVHVVVVVIARIVAVVSEGIRMNLARTVARPSRIDGRQNFAEPALRPGYRPSISPNLTCVSG